MQSSILLILAHFEAVGDGTQHIRDAKQDAQKETKENEAGDQKADRIDEHVPAVEVGQVVDEAGVGIELSAVWVCGNKQTRAK